MLVLDHAPAETYSVGENTTLGRSFKSSAKGHGPQFSIHSPEHKHTCKSIDCPKRTVFKHYLPVLFHDLLLSHNVLGEAHPR